MAKKKSVERYRCSDLLDDGGSMVFTNMAGGWTVATRGSVRPVTDPQEIAALDLLYGPREPATL